MNEKLSSDKKTNEHRIREIEQINLLLKKMIEDIDVTDSNPEPDRSGKVVITKIDGFKDLITKLNFELSGLDFSQLHETFMTKLHHELQTPLVPVKAYVDMLLQGKYGTLTETQLQKLKLVKENIGNLEDNLHKVLEEKKLIHQYDTYKIEKLQHRIKEIEQEKQIQTKIIEDMQKAKDLKDYILSTTKNDAERKIQELQQEKILLAKLAKEKEIRFKLSKKYYVSIALIVVVASSSFIVYSFYQNQVLLEAMKVPLGNYNSKYVIQNLKGDTIDTWLSWRLLEGQILHVNMVNAYLVSQDKIDAIKSAILSEDVVELDDSLLHKGPKGTSSTYYKGWGGALKKTSEHNTKFHLPQKFSIIEAPAEEAEVTIMLSNEKDGDGYSGYTKSISDNNQILKTTITIYEIDKLSSSQLSAITRHEFGHALGLAHSTAPEDLMHDVIKTDYPYISDCDIDAIASLYDGSKNSEVVCQK